MRRRQLLPFYFLSLLGLSSAAWTTACTNRTIITTRATDAGAASATPDDEPDTTPAGGDERDGQDDDDDVPSPPPKKDAGTSSGDGDGDGDGDPVLAGGSMKLTCPPTGFHQNPPITIASVPKALLPRCSATTKACWQSAATNAEIDACLAADTTPAVMLDGEPLDCAGCERTQGSYCMASACKSEFAAYGCCAQANGNAACSAELSAVIDCARTSGKAAFTTCLTALVPQCFP